MLKQIIEATKLSPEFCAHLLGVPSHQFRDWLDNKRPVPRFVMSELLTVLGVTEKELSKSAFEVRQADKASITPAIWFKLRDEKLLDADREVIALIRRLGFFAAQLDQLREAHSPSLWLSCQTAVLDKLDRTTSPAAQGKEAAKRFRRIVDLNHGQTGVGEILRPKLRRIGLTIIEAPIPKSQLEGCCFNVGKDNTVLPFIFANTFEATWFRRNEVILHEVCHALFDVENDPVSLDFKVKGEPDFVEARARAFAQECLIPCTVLNHYGNQFGLKWGELSEKDIANLMASIHAEQATVIRAMYENGLISENLRDQYSDLACMADLKLISQHALTTAEYLDARSGEDPKWIAKNRNTTLGPRPLRLPVGYINQVIEALNEEQITEGKAAEMLMMDRETFLERFGELVLQLEGIS